MPDRMPEDMSDRVPEDMPDRMPEDLPDRMPEDMPEDMPDHMPEDMPDRMSNRMSEDMSDRMPEDLPVRKCINVMVGITRSKVILSGLSSTVLGQINIRKCHKNEKIFVKRHAGFDLEVGHLQDQCRKCKVICLGIQRILFHCLDVSKCHFSLVVLVLATRLIWIQDVTNKSSKNPHS